MTKLPAILASSVFLILVPGTVAGLVPYLLTDWESERPSDPTDLSFIVGTVLVFIGTVGLLEPFLRFAIDGRGTPAPIAPPDRLVISGSYRYVRNPMYVFVIANILGQAILLSSSALLLYATAFWGLCHLFVVIYEEPMLARTFGPDYRHYTASVNRWLPRPPRR